MTDEITRGRVTPEDEELFRSYGEIADALREETDRAAAILAASFLESNLERAIRLAMVEGVDIEGLFKAYAPLSTFSGKIDVAHAFGITSAKSHRDLSLLRKIRNHFAHHPRVTSFAVSPVRDWSMELSKPEPAITEDPELAHINYDDPRQRYIACVARLMVILWTNSKTAPRAKPPRL